VTQDNFAEVRSGGCEGNVSEVSPQMSKSRATPETSSRTNVAKFSPTISGRTVGSVASTSVRKFSEDFSTHPEERQVVRAKVLEENRPHVFEEGVQRRPGSM